MSEFTETKERIFDAFIEMISALGYENVTIRDIAKRVGINAATIYYHYESKDKILEHVYEYFTRHYFDNRIPVGEMKELIETATAKEMIAAIVRNYLSEDQKKYVRMILITKIIYMRLFQDPVANAMFLENNKNDAEYVINVMKHGVDVGRINPAFDVETFADILIGSMVIMGIKAFADTAYKVGQLDQENRLMAMLEILLSTALK